MREVYQVCRKLKRPPYGVGVYAGYFSRREDAEEFAKKVGAWVEEIFIEEV